MFVLPLLVMIMAFAFLMNLLRLSPFLIWVNVCLKSALNTLMRWKAVLLKSTAFCLNVPFWSVVSSIIANWKGTWLLLSWVLYLKCRIGLKPTHLPVPLNKLLILLWWSCLCMVSKFLTPGLQRLFKLHFRSWNINQAHVLMICYYKKPLILSSTIELLLASSWTLVKMIPR